MDCWISSYRFTCIKYCSGAFMTINELMVFISLVCNFEAPQMQVSHQVKVDCMEYYTNCVIKDDEKINIRLLSNCTTKAKEASRKWGL